MFHLIVHRPLNSGGGVCIPVQTDVKVIFLFPVYLCSLGWESGVHNLRKHW